MAWAYCPTTPYDINLKPDDDGCGLWVLLCREEPEEHVAVVDRVHRQEPSVAFNVTVSSLERVPYFKGIYRLTLSQLGGGRLLFLMGAPNTLLLSNARVTIYILRTLYRLYQKKIQPAVQYWSADQKITFWLFEFLNFFFCYIVLQKKPVKEKYIFHYYKKYIF